jgi:hypothetical protein
MADNFTTFNLLEPSGPVTGLFYCYLFIPELINPILFKTSDGFASF